jgi:hypothetical protein
MQLAISRLTAFAADVVKTLEQRHELVEILHARNVSFADFSAFFPVMQKNMRKARILLDSFGNFSLCLASNLLLDAFQ